MMRAPEDRGLPSQRVLVTLLILIIGIGSLVAGIFHVSPPTKLAGLAGGKDSFREQLVDLEKGVTGKGTTESHDHHHHQTKTKPTAQRDASTGTESVNTGKDSTPVRSQDSKPAEVRSNDRLAASKVPAEPDPCSPVFFATPKGLEPLMKITQMNALKSWAHLDPPPRRIILFVQKDHDAWKDLVKDYPVFKILEIESKNQYGTPFLNDLFVRAQDEKNHESPGARVFALVNSDIILMPEFADVVSTVCKSMKDFLIIGKRANTPKRQSDPWPRENNIDFSDPGWEVTFRSYAKANGEDFIDAAQDYFVFSEGIFNSIPPFLVGRMVWDNWLVQHVTHNRNAGNVAVDATNAVLAIHQTHDYSHLKHGPDPHQGEEKAFNLNVGADGGYDQGFISSAKYVIEPTKIGQSKWETRPRKFVIREK